MLLYLNVQALQVGSLVCEEAGVVDGIGWHVLRGQDAMRKDNTLIILTESGSLVNDAGTTVLSDICVAAHTEGLVLELQKSDHAG